MSQVLTAAQAAKQAGISRPTISRALKNGDLLGKRGNDGRWLIAQPDLDDWLSRRSSVHVERVHEQAVNAENDHMNTLRERVNSLEHALKSAETALAESRQSQARVEGENSVHRERITELTADKNRLLGLLEARPITFDNGGNGFFARLFGRR